MKQPQSVLGRWTAACLVGSTAVGLLWLLYATRKPRLLSDPIAVVSDCAVELRADLITEQPVVSEPVSPQSSKTELSVDQAQLVALGIEEAVEGGTQ